MPRDYPLDPEVEADRRKRESAPPEVAIDDTAYSEPRLRRLEALYGWRPPEIIEHWPCRGCSTAVGMTAQAIDAAKIFNRTLAARGEKPLTKRELAVCDGCRANELEAERARAGARHQAIAALTRELRHGVLPWRESAIADELRGLGADADQILREAAQANENTAPTRGRSKSL